MSEETEVTEEVSVPAPSINVVDIASMLQIIDAAAQRGAFRGEELTSVGAVRDKASAFVNYVKEAQAAKKEEESSAESAE